MKKTTVLFSALILTLVSVGLAAAHGQGSGKKSRMGMHGDIHQQMEEIMEGSYEDLVDYRKESDTDIMPWVENPDDFALMQKMHESMHKENGYEGKIGGCPMHS